MKKIKTRIMAGAVVVVGGEGRREGKKGGGKKEGRIENGWMEEWADGQKEGLVYGREEEKEINREEKK
jgi:hypothetical protein